MFGAIFGGIAKGIAGKALGGALGGKGLLGGLLGGKGGLGSLLKGGLGKLLGGEGFLNQLTELGQNGQLDKQGLEGKLGKERTGKFEKALKAGKDKEVVKALKKQGIKNPEQVVEKLKEALGLIAPQGAASQRGEQGAAPAGGAQGCAPAGGTPIPQGSGGPQGQMGQLIQLLQQLLQQLKQGGASQGCPRAARPQGAATRQAPAFAQLAQNLANATNPQAVVQARGQLTNNLFQSGLANPQTVGLVNDLAQQRMASIGMGAAPAGFATAA